MIENFASDVLAIWVWDQKTLALGVTFYFTVGIHCHVHEPDLVGNWVFLRQTNFTITFINSAQDEVRHFGFYVFLHTPLRGFMRFKPKVVGMISRYTQC